MSAHAHAIGWVAHVNYLQSRKTIRHVRVIACHGHASGSSAATRTQWEGSLTSITCKPAS